MVGFRYGCNALLIGEFGYAQALVDVIIKYAVLQHINFGTKPVIANMKAKHILSNMNTHSFGLLLESAWYQPVTSAVCFFVFLIILFGF